MIAEPSQPHKNHFLVVKNINIAIFYIITSMIILFLIIAFILTWFFIEITLFIVNKFNFDSNIKQQITHKNFIWYLRMLAISLFFFTTVNMYFFANDKLLQAIEYCIGIVN